MVRVVAFNDADGMELYTVHADEWFGESLNKTEQEIEIIEKEFVAKKCDFGKSL